MWSQAGKMKSVRHKPYPRKQYSTIYKKGYIYHDEMGYIPGQKKKNLTIISIDAGKSIWGKTNNHINS